MTYLYSITWYNDIHQREEHCKGFMTGDNYIDAMQKTITHFGESETLAIELEQFSDVDFVEFWDKDLDVFELARDKAAENVLW